MLTDELYFADTEHMSVSRFKKFDRCEVDGMTDFGEPSDAMMVGSYVDHYISGTLEQFKIDNPSLFSTRNPNKGELKAPYRQAEEICKFIDDDVNLTQFMQGDKQTVMTGEIGGVPFKGKFDIYAKGITINDLKIMASITDRKGNYYDFITAWGYDYQASLYQELSFQNTGEKLPFFVCVVTKEEPFNSAIIQVDQVTMDIKLQEVTEKIQHYYNVWKGIEEPIGCGICKSCIKQRTVTPIISLEDLQGGY